MVSIVRVATTVMSVLRTATALVSQATCTEVRVRTLAGTPKHAARAAGTVCTHPPAMFGALTLF